MAAVAPVPGSGGRKKNPKQTKSKKKNPAAADSSLFYFIAQNMFQCNSLGELVGIVEP